MPLRKAPVGSAVSAPPAEVFATALGLQQAGRSVEAETAYRQLLEAVPGHADACNNLGVLLNAAGRHEEALTLFDRLADLEPNLPRAQSNRGVVLKKLGRTAEALTAHRQAITLDPEFHAAHNNLGNLLFEQRAHEQARAHFAHASRQQPTIADYRFMHGKALLECGVYDAAEIELRAAIALEPNHADAWGTLGRLFAEHHRLPEALTSYDRGNALRPDYPGLLYNRGLARLLAGDLPGGWADYEYRWQVPDFPSRRLPVKQPVWNGEPVADKTVLLHAEQGLGDTLQFIRYLPAVAARARRVLLMVQESLAPLIPLPANVELLREGAPLPPFDVVCPLLSLPRLFGTDILSIPVPIPYLQPDLARVDAWRERFPDQGLRIGLVWAGNPSHSNDANRSAELALFRPLLALAGVHVVSLQVGARSADITALDGQALLVDLSPELRDFGDTAAVLAHLDLVLCVDTSVAHLAGALGVPVWLMLPFVPDWRWLLDRDDSPWYPSLRIFRQAHPRDWAGVMAQVLHALKELVPGTAAAKRRLASADLAVEAGRTLLERREFEAATRHFWSAARLHPRCARAYSGLAVVAYRNSRFNEAVTFGLRACRLNPTDPENWSNTGAYLKSTRSLDRALQVFEQGLNANPNYPGLLYNRGLARLLAGDLPGGWADYEYRWQVPDFPSRRLPAKQPVWAGEALTGKTLLLHAEQGLGDTLQFIRYLPTVAARAQRVLLMVQESLAPLIPLPANVELLREGAPLPAFDVVCPLLSLPRLFGTDIQSIPAPIPYLQPDLDQVDAWRERVFERELRTGLRIGLVWAGNSSHSNDANRSTDLSLFRPLLALTGIQVFSLQVGPRSADIPALDPPTPLINLAPELHDFGDTAAVLAHLDLVLCVDTSVAHLAGALGVPVWLLLPFVPDWRWLLDRDDSPWYPSLRIFRQARPRDWAGVISQVMHALKEVLPGTAAAKRRLASADLVMESGRALLERREFDPAARQFWSAIRQHPLCARAFSGLAVVAYRNSRFNEAVTFGLRACRLSPNNPENWSNTGAYLKSAKQPERGLVFQRQAIALSPDNAGAHSNLANTLSALRHWEEALTHARHALSLKPASADFHYNLGIILKELGQFDEARDAFQKAQKLANGHVKAALHEALIDLLQGHFNTGWKGYESRWLQPDCKEVRSFTKPQWFGEPLAGKRLLVHAEQGFGDSFQFLRYLPLVEQAGGEVIVVVQPDLEPFVRRMPGNHYLVKSGAPLPDFDFHCPLLSLPLGFGTRIDSIPAAVPYLSADTERIAHWKARLAPFTRRRVAIVWAGRPTHANDANRSMPLSLFHPLLSHPEIDCVALQKGDAVEQMSALPEDCRILNLSDELNSFDDTAAILQLVDELVTVDTSVAHLAGALGRPVRIFLPLIPDWRWQLNRADCPWYPTAHLYRQTRRGDWSEPVAQLVRDLD